LKATVIILSWNGVEELPACLDAALAQEGAAVDLLVVDNGSADGSAALVRERYPVVRLVENGRNLGFAAGMNVGMRLLRDTAEPPDVVVLLNQDTIVAPDWLRSILAPFEEDDQIGAVGCKIYYSDGRTLQHAGAWIEPARAIPRHYGYGESDQGQYDQPRTFEYVTGAALALRMRALDQVGLLDEGYTHFFEDVDLCWRLRRASYLVHYAPAATLRHAESRSVADPVRRGALFNRNRLRYIAKTFPSERLWIDFRCVERAFLLAYGFGAEARALQWAYFQAILYRDEWRRAREQFYRVTDVERADLEALWGNLRRDLVGFMRQRGFQNTNR
jgi:GT2 family glycosyltransferase